MIDPDIEIFTALGQYLRNGEGGWLCTVIQTFGSSPRPPGSMMVVSADGALQGSLSGGCVEDDLIEKLLTRSPEYSTPPVRSVYGKNADEAERFSLPCGGQLHILVEYLPATSQAMVDELVSELSNRKNVLRRVNLHNGDWSIEPQLDPGCVSLSEHELLQPLGPQHRLILVGAGPLAESIAQLAPALGYRVVVCDPRPERLAQLNLTDTETIQGMPDDIIRELCVDSDTSILALSHDPRIDDMALMEALDSSAAYVGALGSVRTAAKRRERLLELGIDATQLDLLHAPVGLDIGAKTPAEIAVAILAELMQLRR